MPNLTSERLLGGMPRRLPIRVCEYRYRYGTGVDLIVTATCRDHYEALCKDQDYDKSPINVTGTHMAEQAHRRTAHGHQTPPQFRHNPTCLPMDTNRTRPRLLMTAKPPRPGDSKAPAAWGS